MIIGPATTITETQYNVYCYRLERPIWSSDTTQESAVASQRQHALLRGKCEKDTVITRTVKTKTSEWTPWSPISAGKGSRWD